MVLPFQTHTFGDPQQRLLRGIPAFAALPLEARQALASHLSEESFGKDTVVLDEGDAADRLFIIEDGEVEVSITTHEGRAPLCHLSEGEMFGEIGLLLASRRRTARVTTIKPTHASTLRAVDLYGVLEKYPDAKGVLIEAANQALVRSFVKCTRPFERLTPERLQYFGECLRALEFPAGATIFKQGDPGDACYLIRSGAVEVLRNDAGGERAVARLEAGDIVGESALLTSTPRDATLRVLEPALLLALRREDLIGALDQDKRVADHMVQLMRHRDRPTAKPGILLQPRPTAVGDTIWVLADPARFGVYHQLSSVGLFVWKLLDGTNNVDEVVAKYPAERGVIAPEEVARIMAELVQAGFAHGRELDAEAASAMAPTLPWWQRLWRKLVALFGG